MKRIIYILIASALLCACEHEFDIEGQMGDSVIHILFTPSNDHDSTFFYVQATTPLYDGYHPVKTEGESVTATVNGAPLSLEKAPKRSRMDGYQAYWTGYKFKSGDEIKVEASIPGRKSVSSSATVPHAFPEYSWNYHLEGDPSGYDCQLCIDLEYDNLPECSGRYGIAMITERTETLDYWKTDESGEIEWFSEEPAVSIYREYPQSPSEMTLADLGGSLLVIQPERLNNNWQWNGTQYHALAWIDLPDKKAEKSKQQLRVNYRADRTEEVIIPKEEEYPEWEDIIYPDYDGYRYTSSSRHKLVLYSFDESCYNYLKARETENNNVFAILGLSPASFTYTNVKNGIGQCGSYLTQETDWFTVSTTTD